MIDVGWGSYGEYEGPYFRGTFPLKLKENHDFLDEAMYVFSRTEGRLDSVNMYDSCILSISCAQWCARVHNAYAMTLGLAKDKFGDDNPIKLIQQMLERSSANLQKIDDTWNFYIDFQKVVTPKLLRKLFFDGASGKKGEWTPKTKQHAIDWARIIIETLRLPSMIDAQIEYTKPRMMNFVLNFSREYLFANDSQDNDIGRCAKTAYLSFAGNNPKWANDSVKRFASSTDLSKWSSEWLVMFLKEMTFGPNIAIYPHRYDAIASALRSVYDVNIPRTSLELRRAKYIKLNQQHVDETSVIPEKIIDQKIESKPVIEKTINNETSVSVIELSQEKLVVNENTLVNDEQYKILSQKKDDMTIVRSSAFGFQALISTIISLLQAIFRSFR